MPPAAERPRGAPASPPPGRFDQGVLGLAPRLRAYIRRRVENDTVADDLVQETLLKVYRARSVLRADVSLEAWIFRIARGTVVDHYRRRRPQEELPAALAGESPAELAALRARIMASVQRFLGDLPATYREPVRLAELEGLPLARVALRLGLSLTAVKSRVRRGRALLRKKLQACCRFEVDRFGRVIDFEHRRRGCCEECGAQQA